MRQSLPHKSINSEACKEKLSVLVYHLHWCEYKNVVINIAWNCSGWFVSLNYSINEQTISFMKAMSWRRKSWENHFEFKIRKSRLMPQHIANRGRHSKLGVVTKKSWENAKTKIWNLTNTQPWIAQGFGSFLSQRITSQLVYEIFG